MCNCLSGFSLDVCLFQYFTCKLFLNVNLIANVGLHYFVFLTCTVFVDTYISLIEKDHLGDWSPEKDCC